MTLPGPVLSSRAVYTGRIFDVTVDRVRLPHGREADLEIVRHDGSVVLLPITGDGRELLVRQ
jgi:ADP-ribose pyrophosphatase